MIPLSQCPPEHMLVRLQDVQRMADRLEELGYTKAAADTNRLEASLRSVFNLAPSGLREVWREVEELDAGGCSQKQTR